MDLERMRALLAALQEARYTGVRSVSYDGKNINYGSDAELANAIADDIAGEAFHRIRRIAVVADQPAGTGGDRVARSGDQRVHMGAGCTEAAQATMGLCGIETADDRPQPLAESLECHGSQTL